MEIRILDLDDNGLETIVVPDEVDENAITGIGEKIKSFIQYHKELLGF